MLQTSEQHVLTVPEDGFGAAYLIQSLDHLFHRPAALGTSIDYFHEEGDPPTTTISARLGFDAKQQLFEQGAAAIMFPYM